MSRSLLLYALIALGCVLGLLLVFGIVLAFAWPWWVGIFLVILLLGVGIAAVIVRKVVLRRKEQLFVAQIIEQDNAYVKSMKDDEKKNLADIQDKWKEAVGALKKSHLKKFGNPLYVLPWYMVIGESGAGKTTSIKSARLSSPFAEYTKISGFSGTKNCDWWFFEQAIIIDTAGRYAIPVDEGRDKDEWQKFVALLAKYRKREPLNGLVVAVATDKLLQSRPELIEEDGRNIRRRIDELMRGLGSRFPIYVLVTKCDLIQGMTQFCSELSEANQQQAFGMINHTMKADPEAFLKSGMHTLSERLRNIRLLQLHKSDPRYLDPALLLFPEEFSKLEEGLTAFMKAAFKENPYQESPLLRGLYFSSGKQEGSPYSHFLKNLGLIEERDVLPGTNKGLFLHDFFAKILPRERHLFAPTQRAIEWTRLTRNLGLLSWLLISIALCGLLSFSFVKNISIIRSVPREAPVLKGNLLSDVSMLEDYRRGIVKVVDGNRGWWIPRFGLSKSRDIEGRLKENYCRLVEQGIVSSMDRKINQDIAVISPTTSDSAYALYAIHLVRRINLISERIRGAGYDELKAKPQPSYLAFVPAAGGSAAPETVKSFANLYLFRLVWDEDTESLRREMKNLKAALASTLDRRRGDFRWVAVCASESSPLPGASLKEFWGGSIDLPDEPLVPGAFTLEGKKRVEAIFEEICTALGDAQAVNARKPAFQAWYRQNYLAAWENFARSFPKGMERLRGKMEWDQAASKMGTREGPYFSLLRRMESELGPYDSGEVPAWLALVKTFNSIADQAAVAGAAGGGSLLNKVAETGTRIKGKLSGSEGAADAAEARLKEIKAFSAYMASLADANSSLKGSRLAIFQAATATFTGGQADSTPFLKANGALLALKSGGLAPGEGLWQLMSGPLDFLWAYACQETACHLQDLWVKEVLTQVQGITDPTQISAILGGPQGIGSRFMQGPAAPFLNRSLSGYSPKEVMGRKVAFEAGFLSFSARAGKPVQSNFIITITGLPTDANADAAIKPHATRLEIGCGNEMVTIENLNYPVRKTVNYSPQMCGTTVLTIEVGNTTLTRQYEGNLGFSKFLSEFPSGQHTFVPGDFPGQAASLKRMGIRYIKVNYRFDGNAREAAGLFSQGLGRAPEKIVSCWGQ
jgi:type VI secretion system protein ImpL